LGGFQKALFIFFDSWIFKLLLCQSGFANGAFCGSGVDRRDQGLAMRCGNAKPIVVLIFVDRKEETGTDGDKQMQDGRNWD